MSSVLVIVVNYRVGDLTIDCLNSLAPELAAVPSGRVVVVDNASGDGSAEAIDDAIRDRGWGSWARFVRSERNVGFAAGNNLGYREGLAWSVAEKPDYVFFLNPDTVVRPGAIRILMEFLEAHPQVGIAGGRSEDPDGTPQHCCFRFPSIVNEFSATLRLGMVDRVFRGRIARVPIADEPHLIGWVSGAAMMVRRTVLDQIGLFDEKYFLYYEETDLLLRAHRAGWSCWHIPQARIIHLVGYSSGVTVRHRRPGRKPSYWFESRRRFFLKNRGAAYAALADLAAITGSALGGLKRKLSRRENNDPPHFLADLIRQSVFLKGARVR